MPVSGRTSEQRRNEAMRAIHAYYATWGSMDGRPTIAQAERIVRVLDEAGLLKLKPSAQAILDAKLGQ